MNKKRQNFHPFLTGFAQSGKIREKMVISDKVRGTHGKSWNFIYCLEESRFKGTSKGKFR